MIRFELLPQFENYYSRLICLKPEDLQKRNLTELELRVVNQLREANPKFVEWDKQRREDLNRISALRDEIKDKPTAEQTKEIEALKERLRTSARMEFSFNSDLWGPVELAGM